jgi:oxalate decarboxylase
MKNLSYVILGMTLFLYSSSMHATPAISKQVAPENTQLVNTKYASPEIKLFVEQHSKQLSTQFPYRLNLFEKGQIDENKAGVRIAENAKQFDKLGLTGLLFYYKLFDHSMRVPHWHANADEVGVVLNGKMKITIWEGEGKSKIFTVEKNGTWLIPKASLHALENVGDTELDFIVAYNSSNAADRDFATAWAALPNELLERSLGLSSQDIETLKKTTKNRLSLSDPSSVPENAVISSPLSGNFSAITPLYTSALGTIRRLDEKTTPAMQAMAIQQTIVNPGTMREPHWYTGGDTLLFVTKGQAFFTMMDSEGKVYKTLVKPGDLIFIPIGTFHSYVNIATENLEIYEVFNASKGLSEVNLLTGAQQFSAGTLSSATGLDKSVTEKILKKAPQQYMVAF